MKQIELTKANLDNYISKRIKLYKESSEDAIAAYNREIELIKSYNGRQILELIQNADDACATELRFELNEPEHTLRVYNNGEPFSFDGIRSLMIANLSGKISQNYIGNKGLGFRSILNWGESVSIYSSGLKITFSDKIAQDIVETKLHYDLHQIREEQGRSESWIPFPILAIPEVTEESCLGVDKKKGCMLQIQYREEYHNDILKQLRSIDNKTLLFLKNIETVIVPGNIHQIERQETKSKAKINGEVWEIKTEERELPSKYQDKSKREKKRYCVKIALPTHSLLKTKDSVIFNYLPTRERISLPLILHATLELDDSRNHINENELNEYILGRAAELIRSYSEDLLSKTIKDKWLPYKLMTPIDYETVPSFIRTSLYDKLSLLRERMEILPTITGKYVSYDQYYYYGQVSSTYWSTVKNINSTKCMSNILIPFSSNVTGIQERRINIIDLVSDLNQLSGCSIMQNNERATLISHLCKNIQLYFDGNNVLKSPLQLFTDTNGFVIKSGVIFTPKEYGSPDYKLPDYVSLSFINKELYETLLHILEEEVTEAKGKQDSDARGFSKAIRPLISVFDYDKTAIARTIIARTNEELEKHSSEHGYCSSCIKQMVTALYEMELGAKCKMVKLINMNNEIVDASELLLPTEVNCLVFHNHPERFVQAREFWGVENSDGKYESLMENLGVNCWINDSELGCPSENYFNYLRSDEATNIGGRVKYGKFWEKTNGHIFKRIIHESWLNELDINQLLLLVCSTGSIFSALFEPIGVVFWYNGDKYDWNFSKYNYVRFQLSRLNSVFGNVFGLDLILPESLDRNVLASLKESKLREVVNAISTQISSLDEGKIVTILNSFEGKDIKPSAVRKLYSLIIDDLFVKDISLKGAESLKLLCTDDKYYDKQDVFYANNTCLPKRIIEQIGLHPLSFPSRQGEHKVSQVLGISTPDDAKITVDDYNLSEFDSVFQSEFNRIKPYILLYAVPQNAKYESKESAADKIKKTCVHVVTSCSYSVNMQSGNFLQESEFISDYNTGEYFLMVNESHSVEEMRADKELRYCNAFSEITSMALKLETRNDSFIHIFRDPEFMIKVAKDSFSTEILDGCFELMGKPKEEVQFWNKVVNLVGQSSVAKEDYLLWAENFFDIKIDKGNLVDYSSWDNTPSIELLKQITSKMTEDQSFGLLREIDLRRWHLHHIKQTILTLRTGFISDVWKRLDACPSEQHFYNERINEYDSCSPVVEEIAHILEPDYDSIVRNWIRDKFNIILTDDIPQSHGNLYEDLIKNENEIEDDNIRSLLRFSGHEEEIKQYIETIRAKEHEIKELLEQSPSEDYKKDLPKTVTFHDASEITKGPIKAAKQRRKGGGIHSSQSDQKNVLSGKQAELKVRAYLLQNEIKYHWMSGYSDEEGKNDMCGYDFEYYIDGEWRMLEVKSSSDKSFKLSQNEFSVATRKDYIDRYDIALVIGEDVHIYKAFFRGKYHSDVITWQVSFL